APVDAAAQVRYAGAPPPPQTEMSLDGLEPLQAAAPRTANTGVTLPDAVALVERVRASAAQSARVWLDAPAEAIPVSIVGIAIRRCPELPPTIEERIADNRAQTMGDSVMYREALAAAAEARGWRVVWYDRDLVFRGAAATLGCKDVRPLLAAMGRCVGPPWQATHKLAAAAAIAAHGAVDPST